MSGYQYFIPQISVAPPDGYQLREELLTDAMAGLLNVGEAELAVERRLFTDGREVGRYPSRLILQDGEWSGDGATFDLDSIDDGAWQKGESVGYVETHISLESPGLFASPFVPPNYRLYYGPARKTFFSDSALKYGNTVVIYQIQAFGQWVEGYPLAGVDREADIGESVVLINPFTRPATVRIDLVGIEKGTKVRVDPMHARRVPVADLIGDDPRWHGQILVSGRARLITMFAKHSLADPCQITTVEHSDPYRGEPTHIPLTLRLRQSIGGAIHQWLSRA